jgi:MFS family permease
MRGQTILGTAIPKITDDFPDLTKVGWYGSAYFMTFGGFQSSWGKLYKYFSLKLWFLVALFIFEVGSLICGVAKDPVTLIVGRAIAGMGGAGVGTGVFTMIGLSTTPEKRPTLIGYVGAAYGLAAVLGPIVGGALTESVSWRWVWSRIKFHRTQLICLQCFYINLPIGGVTSVVVIFLFTTNLQPTKASTKEKLLQMDPVGVILMMSLIISYILALQYGGQTHAWNNSTVIGLLVGFGLMLPAFIAWEIYQKERAMIVPRLVRSTAFKFGLL